MMPKVIGNDSLIARVNEVQGCMYQQSNELGRLNKAVRRYKEENTKLRDLVKLMFSCPMSKSDCDKCRRLNDLCIVEVLAHELGIEVGQ